MKSKIGITVFSNGDMDILQASLWEDLWNDYVFYRKKSHHQSEKGTKKGEFLARRYERAACLTLYEWFDAIVSRWIWETSGHHALEGAPLLLKCQRLLMLTKKEEEFSHLFGFLQRVDVNRQVLLETINDDRLDDMEASFCHYISYIETSTTLTRFPEQGKNSKGLLASLLGNL